MIVLIWKFHIERFHKFRPKIFLFLTMCFFLWASMLLTTSLKWLAKKKWINKYQPTEDYDEKAIEVGEGEGVESRYEGGDQ